MTERDLSGYVEIQGIAPLSSVVTVNSQLADRQGEYYRKELSVSTTSAAAYTGVTVSGTGLTSSAGKVFAPKDSDILTYDASGNLTQDGRWDYSWDGENRLVKMVTRSSVAGISGFPFRRLEFVYDTQGRRIEKRVYNVASGGSEITHKKYLYDGWNLLMEVDAINSSNNVTYTWGLDLSGTDQGAGGVGGLLMIHDSTTHFVAMDGNGNVAALTDGTEVTGQYEYDPFGNLLRVTGSAGVENPFRFSTKYWDGETGLVYYGFRYYSPVLGRWVNRDPVGEVGGNNLYRFVHNNGINRFDLFGLKDYKAGTADPLITPDAGAGAWDSKEWTWSMLYLRQLIVHRIGIVWLGMPDAVNHMQHYFGNSGEPLTIRLQKMIDDVPSAKNVYNGELALAKAFVESLSDGKHSITSGNPSNGYNQKDESWNWFYAVGGYSAWGKGNATVCKGEYTLEFQYKFYDRYNWDGGKQVTILGLVVTDRFIGEFHQQGLAREFDMFGAVKKTVKWKKGQAVKVTEGWESEQSEQGR